MLNNFKKTNKTGTYKVTSVKLRPTKSDWHFGTLAFFKFLFVKNKAVHFRSNQYTHIFLIKWIILPPTNFLTKKLQSPEQNQPEIFTHIQKTDTANHNVPYTSADYKCQFPLILRAPELFKKGCLQLTVHIDIEVELHEAIAKLILLKGVNVASYDLGKLTKCFSSLNRFRSTVMLELFWASWFFLTQQESKQFLHD